MSSIFDDMKILENQQKGEIAKIKHEGAKVRSRKVTYVRKTFAVTDVHFKALELMKVSEEIDISVNVREALDKHIPEEYINKAKELLNK